MIRLYELRTEADLSQRAIAKQMRVCQATYNHWENEKTQPSIERESKISRAFRRPCSHCEGVALPAAISPFASVVIARSEATKQSRPFFLGIATARVSLALRNDSTPPPS